MAIFNQQISEVFKTFASSEKGLSSAQAEKNKIKFGENKFATKKKTSVLKRFGAQFKNIMIIVLLCSALISTIIEF